MGHFSPKLKGTDTPIKKFYTILNIIIKNFLMFKLEMRCKHAYEMGVDALIRYM